MKKYNGNYYSINDCLVNELTKIIIKLILLNYNFIVKEGSHLSYSNHDNLALHIETVNLADGDYELVPADSLATPKVNLNCASVNQDLGQAPEDSHFDSAQEGKPRCITHYFLHYIHLTIDICCNNFICTFTFSLALIENLRCMIPRYLCLISESFYRLVALLTRNGRSREVSCLSPEYRN